MIHVPWQNWTFRDGILYDARDRRLARYRERGRLELRRQIDPLDALLTALAVDSYHDCFDL